MGSAIEKKEEHLENEKDKLFQAIENHKAEFDRDRVGIEKELDERIEELTQDQRKFFKKEEDFIKRMSEEDEKRQKEIKAAYDINETFKAYFERNKVEHEILEKRRFELGELEVTLSKRVQKLEEVESLLEERRGRIDESFLKKKEELRGESETLKEREEKVSEIEESLKKKIRSYFSKREAIKEEKEKMYSQREQFCKEIDDTIKKFEIEKSKISEEHNRISERERVLSNQEKLLEEANKKFLSQRERFSKQRDETRKNFEIEKSIISEEYNRISERERVLNNQEKLLEEANKKFLSQREQFSRERDDTRKKFEIEKSIISERERLAEEKEAKISKREYLLKENETKNIKRDPVNITKQEGWSFFRSNLIASKALKPNASNDNHNPRASIQATLVAPLMTNLKSVWREIGRTFYTERNKPDLKGIFFSNNRANKFKVVSGIYDEDNPSKEVQEERIKNTFIQILAKVANENDLNKNQILAIIETAKVRGGIFNAINPVSGNYFEVSKLPKVEIEGGKVSTATAQKFSANFQKECQACGIYSGRLGAKSFGLRLTFVPDDVVGFIKGKDVNFELIKKHVSRAQNNELATVKQKVAQIFSGGSFTELDQTSTSL